MISTPEQRNWKGVIIATLVILCVIGLIVTSIILITPPDGEPRVKGRRFTIEDILNGDFNALRFNGTWVSGKITTTSCSKIRIMVPAHVHTSLFLAVQVKQLQYLQR